MIFFSEKNEPIIVDDLYAPIVNTHVWVLDLEQDDFTLTPLKVMQEVACPSILLEVDGLRFMLPANWYVLIYDDEESTMMDVVLVSELAGRPFKLFRYGFSEILAGSEHYKTLDYSHRFPNIVPQLNKKQMLCHPINDKQWICVAPTDAFCKRLKDMSVGDIT